MKIFYSFLSRCGTILTVIIILVLPRDMNEPAAKPPSLTEGYESLNLEEIENYINSQLMTPNIVFQTFGIKLNHATTRKWLKTSLNVRFVGEEAKKYAGYYTLLQKPLFDLAGLNMKSLEGDADILVVMSPDILQKILQNKSVLDRYRLGKYVINSVKKGISKVDVTRRCHLTLFTQPSGEITFGIALVDTRLKKTETQILPKNITTCMHNLSYWMLGRLPGVSSGTSWRQKKILQMLSVYVIYSINQTNSPFIEISPKAIRKKLEELYTEKGGNR